MSTMMMKDFNSSSVSSSDPKKSFVIPASSEGYKVELYSPQYYGACTVGGILSYGLTHMTVTPLDLVKCNLQQIWTEIGESDADKDRMLAKLERECLQVYHRKVDDVANAKARLHQCIAAKEAELATLMASLGELNINSPG